MSDEIAGISAPRRGWSSQGLPVVAIDDPDYWSVFDMTITLGLTEAQVVSFVRLARLQRVGKRHAGSRRRHIPVYQASQALEAYEKIAPLLSLGVAEQAQ